MQVDAQNRLTTPLSNDTSCGVGFAPLSRLERAVRAVEEEIDSRETKTRRPAWGEDVKVMGFRDRNHATLTVVCALIGAHVPSATAYQEECRELGCSPTVRVDAADDTRSDQRQESGQPRG